MWAVSHASAARFHVQKAKVNGDILNSAMQGQWRQRQFLHHRGVRLCQKEGYYGNKIERRDIADFF
jgi:hypothetical protein